MRVTVVGAGKMGLPLACQFASRGADVTVCDVRKDAIDQINRGECPIDEPGVGEMLARAVREGSLRGSIDTAAAARVSDVIVVIVPVLLTPDRDAETSIIESVSRQIAQGLRPGAMVVYETTLPVGGTRKLGAILETGGLKAGTDFDLVFSPERVKSQLVLQRLTENPKVVGGSTPKAAERAADFYTRYLGAPVINVGTLEASELVKLAGMIYRDVNIALSNQLARYAEATGIDIYPVIAAANNDGEAALLTPGIGVGGHCTPVYPYFYIRDSERLGVPASLASLGRGVNDEQAAHTVSRLSALTGSIEGRKVLILGLAFRPQVKEHIFSTAFLLRDELRARGAEALLDDPLYSDEEIRAHGFEPYRLSSDALPEAVILNTAHDAYRNLDFAGLYKRGVRIIVDGRAAWKPEQVRREGLEYVAVGRPAGAAPAAAPQIPIVKPLIGASEADAAARTIRTGWLAQGPQVAKFEGEFREFTGAAHAVAAANGTAALHLALLMAGVGPGDEVITVSHSFIATANSIRYCGALPVFVDIDPATYNMDPEKLEAAISPRTRAILCVHQMGMPCDLSRILAIARRRNILVIEDAACAIGSEIEWEGAWGKIGRPHGDLATFSFHPRKLTTTGDGGMVTTANSEWARQMRLLRQHGMDVTDTVRHASAKVIFESYPVLGYNYRMTDMQAAVGREQLKRLPGMIEARRRLAERYRSLLSNLSGIELPHEPRWARSNWQSFCIRVASGEEQKLVMQAMLDAGVATRRGVMCAHREGAYPAGTWRGADLGHSEYAQDRGIILPLYPQMTEAEQDRVVERLRAALPAASVQKA